MDRKDTDTKAPKIMTLKIIYHHDKKQQTDDGQWWWWRHVCEGGGCTYIDIVVVCNDLSNKELHTQVDVCEMVISGSLGGDIVNTLALNARYVGSIPALSTLFPIFFSFATTILK